MADNLSDRHRATLEAVCDTLLPEIARADDPHGLYATGARASGAAARAAALIASLRDPRDAARIRTLLTALDSRVANLVLGGRFSRFATLSREKREAVLRDWALSRLPLRRAGFQALKRLAHVAHFCWPLPEGSHPAWRAVGYPGPLPPPARGIEPLPALAIDRDTTLECDVVIAGSGAGGGVVAGVLAEAGRSVVVLEKGPNPGVRDMTQIEGEMLGALYLDGGLLMTQSGSMPILAGSCVGGGTTINWTTSFPLPDAIRAEWDDLAGFSLFSRPRFAESLSRVATRLNLAPEWDTPSPRDVLLERGCRALGWHVDAQPRNVTGCRDALACGYCGYGCRQGAKNSTAATYLRDAVRAGARLIPQCDVERVLAERGRATGVEATVRRPGGAAHRLTVRARAVVVACGAIYTPALLRRSGLSHPRIGRGLRLHPATGVVGVFEELVEPWRGPLQTRYSDQLADMDGGYGARFETAPIHFALPASGFGWEGAERFRDDVGQLARTGIAGVLLRDRHNGRVAVTREGRPRAHYELSRYDAGHVRQALRGAAEILAAAGARELVSLHTPPVRVRPNTAGWLERFATGMDARGYTRARLSYISFHQMATAAMGRDPTRGVVGESGESFHLAGLYVADGSAFPTSSGVNPMITIMAIADHVARAIAESW